MVLRRYHLILQKFCTGAFDWPIGTGYDVSYCTALFWFKFLPFCPLVFGHMTYGLSQFYCYNCQASASAVLQERDPYFQ